MDIQTFLTNILAFLNNSVVPFIMALAGLFFFWNTVRYFIIGGANEESQQKAKTLATWGIAAFVVILSLWGIVNLLVDGLGLQNETPASDYMQTKGVGGGNVLPDCTDRPVC